MDIFDKVPCSNIPVVYADTLSHIKEFSSADLEYLSQRAEDELLRFHLKELLALYHGHYTQRFREKRDTILLYLRHAYEQTMDPGSP